MGLPRKIMVGASAAALTAAGIALAPTSDAAATCGVLFDDFAYASRTDPALAQRGWRIRGTAGGPGVPGAAWRPGNITFPTVDGQQVVQLTASTDGTAAGTTHAEFSLTERRFFEGTYLARIRFADTPASGPDGDHVNQTFYSISPLAAPRDPDYSELDFSEYLPNGGWGGRGPTNYQTTWFTYVADPWYADNQHSQQAKSIAGWRDVMATVADGHVKYYIDGALVADHSGKVYPRQNMSIDFNQWFIDLAGRSGGGTSVWQQSVDYVFHAKGQTLTPQQAGERVAALRRAGTTHTDSVVAANDCAPDPAPPAAPVASPSSSAAPVVSAPPAVSAPPVVSAPPAVSAPPVSAPPSATVPPATTAPATDRSWAPGTRYTAGTVVTYRGVRYRARQTHTSARARVPSRTPALWRKL